MPGSATKNGEAFEIPIALSVITMLQDLPRTSDWVFPTEGDNSRHIYSLTKQWNIVTRDAGYPHVRLHDLRRSFGCLLLDQTGDTSKVRDSLNHTNADITQTYAFYNARKLRPVLENHAQVLDLALDLDRREA